LLNSLPYNDAKNLIRYLWDSPEERTGHLRELIANSVDLSCLQAHKLPLLEELKGDFPALADQVELLKRPIDSNLHEFIMNHPEEGMTVVRELIAIGADNADFSGLSDVLIAHRALRSELETWNKLKELVQQENGTKIKLRLVGEFLASSDRESIQTVKTLVKTKFGAQEFFSDKLNLVVRLKKIRELFDDNNQLRTWLKLIGNSPLDLRTGCDFILFNSGKRLPFVRFALTNDHLDLLNPQKLDKYSHLIDGLPVEAAVQILKSDSQGLPVLKLGAHMLEHPNRIAFVAGKLNTRLEGANELINHLRIPVMPAEVSQRVVCSGSKVLNQTIRSLNNWRSGQAYYDFLVEHVRKEDSFTADDATRLSRRAEDATHHGYRPNINWIAKEYKDGDSLITRCARHIVISVDAIQRKIDADQPLVLLGRGMQPMVSGLRAAGAGLRNPELWDVKYFLWTREQIEDKSTQRQWLKEVAPHSIVIDNGFTGQIFDAIANIDSSHSFNFLSSANPEKYPQLLDRPDSAAIALSFEDWLPRLINRPTGYRESGGAVSRLSGLAWSERHCLHRRPREETTSFIRQTMRELGLSEWYVWRYARFTGLTPQERLGVMTRDEVAAHYQRVEKLR
jgi:hypothetical protein